MPADRLLVFSRVPAAGRVLPMLSPPLEPEEAAAAYEASLRDVVARGARERGRIEIWYEGEPDDRTWFERAFVKAVIERQCDGDRGTRLEDAFARSFADGAERVVIVGADVPTLPEATLTSAFRDLEDAPGVVSPGSNGGYALLGLRKSEWPRARVLFGDGRGAGKAALDTSLERARRLEVDLRVLPGWYAVERPTDLVRAMRDAEPGSHLAEWLRSGAARPLVGG